MIKVVQNFGLLRFAQRVRGEGAVFGCDDFVRSSFGYWGRMEGRSILEDQLGDPMAC